MSKGKILVIRGGAIGDFILTLPVLSALRAAFPDTALEVLGYPHIAGIAKAGGLVHEVRSIEARAMAGFFSSGGDLDKGLQEYFQQFAVIVSYLYDPDEIFKRNVARCSKAQFVTGPHRPTETDGMHATEVFLRPLERLAIFDPDPVPRLRIGKGMKHEAPTVAVHPGSGSERKNWPEHYWKELLHELLRCSSCQLLLVGGEAEGDRLERLSRDFAGGTGTGSPEICRYPELAGELSRCTVFVGHDSGISHLSAALELPTLVLWGDTAEPVWRPLGAQVTILRGPGGLMSIDAERVRESLLTLLTTVRG